MTALRLVRAALLLLIAIPLPASADFMGAEAAVRRGEYPSAYLACKSEADAGDAECQHLVGYLFQEGLGVPLNATEAIRLFRLAAKRGLAIAQCHLGFAYERGFGVSPDDFEAVRWLVPTGCGTRRSDRRVFYGVLVTGGPRGYQR